MRAVARANRVIALRCSAYIYVHILHAASVLPRRVAFCVRAHIHTASDIYTIYDDISVIRTWLCVEREFDPIKLDNGHLLVVAARIRGLETRGKYMYTRFKSS